MAPAQYSNLPPLHRACSSRACLQISSNHLPDDLPFLPLRDPTAFTFGGAGIEQTAGAAGALVAGSAAAGAAAATPGTTAGAGVAAEATADGAAGARAAAATTPEVSPALPAGPRTGAGGHAGDSASFWTGAGSASGFKALCFVCGGCLRAGFSAVGGAGRHATSGSTGAAASDARAADRSNAAVKARAMARSFRGIFGATHSTTAARASWTRLDETGGAALPPPRDFRGLRSRPSAPERDFSSAAGAGGAGGAAGAGGTSPRRSSRNWGGFGCSVSGPRRNLRGVMGFEARVQMSPSTTFSTDEGGLVDSHSSLSSPDNVGGSQGAGAACCSGWGPVTVFTLGVGCISGGAGPTTTLCW
mmetsp:Transcript_60104/g.161208  ORF Transcript_60104/g.161208 Transcript_60104/m.161208 type:complete len:360 (-) Transcript_60104:434-1513(-)